MSIFNASKVNKYVWALSIFAMLFVIVLFVLVSFTKMPDTAELENPKFEQATIIYSEGMEELGRLYEKNREWVTFDELSPNVVDALLATEDRRFYNHSGIDFKGTVRAAVNLGNKGGASTITQQLAKLFFTQTKRNPVKRLWQKMKEWVIAVEFEKRYTKEEIIAMYLNKFEFLHQSFGISAAANTYFGKNHADLNVEEAAVLVGMLKHPRLYNPKLYPENAIKRRNVVLHQLYKNENITKSDFDSLKVLDINMGEFKASTHHNNLAPYFVSELAKEVKSLLKQEKYSKPDGTRYNVYEDGLKIYTTIDVRMQKHAENAMKAHMQNVQKRYFEVWDNIDPWTYDADDRQKKIRLSRLTSQIYSTSRYANMRANYLNEISQNISKNIENVRLWDSDIRRMKEEENKKGHLSRMLAKDQISKQQKATYEQIMHSEDWATLKKQWSKLQNRTKSAFNKKVKMNVFAYNAAGKKEVVMSPLDSIRYHNMQMQIGSMSIEPSTGYVKMWIGGIGHEYFQNDHVLSNRQVGSTFKPFIYTTAIMQGRSPCWKIKDQEYTIKAKDKKFGLMEDWSPKNTKKGYTGEEYTMKECLRKSLNSASVWLMKEIGNVEAVREVASRMGVPEEKIPKYPSICLGTPEVSVKDMTSAYATFANQGVYTDPIIIKKIEDKDGKIIFNANTSQRQALSKNYNYVMLDMLKYAASVVSNDIQSELGGKTGTTNNHVDGWFMGVTPSLVTGTWVGGEYPWIRFLALRDGAGSHMARPFFIDYMRRVEADKAGLVDVSKTFVVPEGDLGIEIDCDKYEQLYQQANKAKEIDFEDDELEEEIEE